MLQMDPLTFKRDSFGVMKRRRKRGSLAIAVNGKAGAVLLDASAYQEVADHLDVVASVRKRFAQARKGEGRLADEVFDELELEESTR